MILSGTQRMVLRTLLEADEPLYNGTLGALTGLRFNSEVFKSLERAKLITGQPYALTEAGRAAIAPSNIDRSWGMRQP